MTEAIDRLQLGLAAEHAAIYAYGVLGAHLTGAERALAREAENAHRAQRDTVADLLSAAGSTPSAAAPAYRIPKPVTDRTSALGLAVDIETKVAAVWRAALAVVSASTRETALDGLVAAGVQAATWRLAAAPTASPTVVWPGR